MPMLTKRCGISTGARMADRFAEPLIVSHEPGTMPGTVRIEMADPRQDLTMVSNQPIELWDNLVVRDEILASMKKEIAYAAIDKRAVIVLDAGP